MRTGDRTLFIVLRFERNSLSIVGEVLPPIIHTTSGNHVTMAVKVGKTNALVDVIHFADPSCWWSLGSYWISKMLPKSLENQSEMARRLKIAR